MDTSSDPPTGPPLVSELLQRVAIATGASTILLGAQELVLDGSSSSPTLVVAPLSTVLEELHRFAIDAARDQLEDDEWRQHLRGAPSPSLVPQSALGHYYNQVARKRTRDGAPVPMPMPLNPHVHIVVANSVTPLDDLCSGLLAMLTGPLSSSIRVARDLLPCVVRIICDIARILGFYFRALQPLPKGSIELPMRHRLLRSVLSVFLHCLQLFSWQPLYDNDSSEPSPSSSPFSAASAELSTIAIGPEVAVQFGTSNPEQATLAAAIVYSINYVLGLQVDMPSWIVGLIGCYFPGITAELLFRAVFFQVDKSEQAKFLTMILELVIRDHHSEVTHALSSTCESEPIVSSHRSIDQWLRYWGATMMVPSVFAACAEVVITRLLRLAESPAADDDNNGASSSESDGMQVEEDDGELGDATTSNDAETAAGILQRLVHMGEHVCDFVRLLEVTPPLTSHTRLLHAIKSRLLASLEQFTDSKGLEVQTAPIAQALANNATGLCELLRTQALAPPRTDKPYWSPSWFYIVAATLHEGEHTGLAFLSTLLCMPDQLSALSALYPALHAAFPKLFGTAIRNVIASLPHKVPRMRLVVLENIALLCAHVSCDACNDDDDNKSNSSSSSKLRTSGYCLSQELFESLDTLYSMLESPLPEMIAKEWSTMQHMALQLARLALTHAIEHADVVHSLEVLIHRHLALLSQRSAIITESRELASPALLQHMEWLLYRQQELVSLVVRRQGKLAFHYALDLLLDALFDDEYASGTFRSPSTSKNSATLLPPANRVVPYQLRLHTPSYDEYTTALDLLEPALCSVLAGSTAAAAAPEPSLLFQNRILVHAKDVNPLRNRLSISKFFRAHLRSTSVTGALGTSLTTADEGGEQLDDQAASMAENRQELCAFVERLLGARKNSRVAIEHFAHALLLRLTPLAPIPSYQQYDKLLPGRSNFPRDVYLRKLFGANPALLSLLSIVSQEPITFCRYLEVTKGLLANTISDWKLDKSLTSARSPYFRFTWQLVSMLAQAHWMPYPLNCCHELLAEVSPSDVVKILMSIWSFVRDFPPTASEYTITDAASKTAVRAFPASMSVEPYVVAIKAVMREHVVRLAPLYGRFFVSPPATATRQASPAIPPTSTSSSASSSTTA